MLPHAEPEPNPDVLPLNDAHEEVQPNVLQTALHRLARGGAVLVVCRALIGVLLLLSSSAAVMPALSLRTCPGGAVPALADQPLSFCTAYSGSEACLAPTRAAFIDGLYPSEDTVAFNKITFADASGSCPDLVRRTMCSRADPWAGTLFDDDDRRIPPLCPAMSSLIWDECADVTMSPNPFGGDDTSRRTLRRLFGDRETFQKAFEGDECYGGVPVDETKPIPSLPSSPSSVYLGQVCLRRLQMPIGNRLLLGGAPYPTRKDVMAIIDKSGVVSVWKLHDLTITSKTWLDVTADVVTDGTKGLLSLAFHKQFAENGRLFLSMTCKAGGGGCRNDGDLVVDEYHVDDPHRFTTPVFARRILYMDGGFDHSIGGQLLFSPSADDDNLFVVVGEGGMGRHDDRPDPLNHGQDLTTLRGKILRLDVDDKGKGPTAAAYAIPSDNPFVGQGDARGEIYALGFKNPWRCSFDRRHPAFLFCGDLGHHHYEELDRIIKGGNYGWRYYEGRHVLDPSRGLASRPVVFPQIEYAHPKGGDPAAIIGGYVFRYDPTYGRHRNANLRSPDEPSSIDGTYFFADQLGKLFSAIGVAESGVYRLTPAAGVWRCARDSPVDCGAALGNVFSLFESGTGEVFVSTSEAIFKIVDPEHCDLDV